MTVTPEAELWSVVISSLVALFAGGGLAGLWNAWNSRRSGTAADMRAVQQQILESLQTMAEESRERETEAMRQVRIRDDYIAVLRRHIEMKKAPPPPPWPETEYQEAIGAAEKGVGR